MRFIIGFLPAPQWPKAPVLVPSSTTPTSGAWLCGCPFFREPPKGLFQPPPPNNNNPPPRGCCRSIPPPEQQQPPPRGCCCSTPPTTVLRTTATIRTTTTRPQKVNCKGNELQGLNVRAKSSPKLKCSPNNNSSPPKGKM